MCRSSHPQGGGHGTRCAFMEGHAQSESNRDSREGRPRWRSADATTAQEALGGSGQAQRIKLAARLSYLSSRSRSPSAVGRYLAVCAKAKLELFRCRRWNAPVPMDELGSGLIVATDAHLD